MKKRNKNMENDKVDRFKYSKARKMVASRGTLAFGEKLERREE